MSIYLLIRLNSSSWLFWLFFNLICFFFLYIFLNQIRSNCESREASWHSRPRPCGLSTAGRILRTRRGSRGAGSRRVAVHVPSALVAAAAADLTPASRPRIGPSSALRFDFASEPLLPLLFNPFAPSLPIHPSSYVYNIYPPIFIYTYMYICIYGCDSYRHSENFHDA